VIFEYTLSDEELALIDRLAIAMRAFAGRSSACYLGDPDEKERAGFAGEIAMAGLWGLPFDEERRISGEGDGGVDYLIYLRGWPVSIDVKTRTADFTDLLVKKSVIDQGNVAEIYVCAHFDGRVVRFLGWETLRRVMHMPVKAFGNGPQNYVCERRYLRPMEALDGLIRRRDGAVQMA
jgi:hypothetical protein